MMLCPVIKGPTFKEAKKQIKKALPYASLIELRLDCFIPQDIEKVNELLSLFPIPMICTARECTTIRKIALAQPHYLDLSLDLPSEFIDEIISSFPKIKIILSYHHYTTKKIDYEEIYQKMQRKGVFYYKMAFMAQECLSPLSFLMWAKKKSRLIAISMGPYGQISRILAPMFGSPFTYASLDDHDPIAPGHLSAKTLQERYHHSHLTSKTGLYGLIGDPVEMSVSDQTHNQLIKTCALQAIYVKMQVSPKALPSFLSLAKEFPFQGLSVTMPLKETILPFLDQIDGKAQAMGAVNTLCFDQGKIVGYNTDGLGALHAIKKKMNVHGKRMIILGAGGAAKAIAYQASQEGAAVTIISRNQEKSKAVAEKIGGHAFCFEQSELCFAGGYDILINATSAPLPFIYPYILPNSFVMDLTTRPQYTAFLTEAGKKGCSLIYGYEMFIEQALLQFQLWFGNQFPLHKARKCITGYINSTLNLF